MSSLWMNNAEQNLVKGKYSNSNITNNIKIIHNFKEAYNAILKLFSINISTFLLTNNIHVIFITVIF